MNTPMRVVANFFLTGLLVIVFQQFGWLEFTKIPHYAENLTFNLVLVASIIGLFMLFIDWILEILFGIFKLATLGLGKFAYPIYFIVAGYLKLYIPSIILGWYEPRASFWIVLLISILIGLIRIPKEKKK